MVFAPSLSPYRAFPEHLDTPALPAATAPGIHQTNSSALWPTVSGEGDVSLLCLAWPSSG